MKLILSNISDVGRAYSNISENEESNVEYGNNQSAFKELEEMEDKNGTAQWGKGNELEFNQTYVLGIKKKNMSKWKIMDEDG